MKLVISYTSLAVFLLCSVVRYFLIRNKEAETPREKAILITDMLQNLSLGLLFLIIRLSVRM